MLRIVPTGNATFDAVERSAQQTYQASLDGSPSAATIKRAEIGYLKALWASAITQLGPTEGPGYTPAYSVVGHRVAVPLDFLIVNLSQQLRNLGIVLPVSFIVAVSATVTVAGDTYAVGEHLALTGGQGAPLVSAVFTVATLTSATVATVTPYKMGLYTVAPTNSAATTTDGTGDNNCTLSVLYASIPIEYAF